MKLRQNLNNGLTDLRPFSCLKEIISGWVEGSRTNFSHSHGGLFRADKTRLWRAGEEDLRRVRPWVVARVSLGRSAGQRPDKGEQYHC